MAAIISDWRGVSASGTRKVTLAAANVPYIEEHGFGGAFMIAIVMGVVGSGKTTIGRLLAESMSWQFADADDFHSPANIAKISQGIPLSDSDREPWLDRLREYLQKCQSQRSSVVLACSALRSSYRQRLRIMPDVRFIYLKGDAKLIAERLRARHGHFAGEQILDSQFAGLEEPEDAITIDISKSPAGIVAEIRKRLGVA
jgi:gluconokinase